MFRTKNQFISLESTDTFSFAFRWLPMKPIKTKIQQRNELNAEIERFLQRGGEVKSVPQGTSGNESNASLFSRSSTPFEPKTERTPVTEVIQALDSRKQKNTTAPPPRKRRPYKKLITDDFGEPIRWVWVEE